MTDSQDKDTDTPEPEDEQPRPRRSGKSEPGPEMPNGWRASRRGSKGYKKARKDIKLIWIIVGVASVVATLMAVFNIIDGLEEAKTAAEGYGAQLAELLGGA